LRPFRLTSQGGAFVRTVQPLMQWKSIKYLALHMLSVCLWPQSSSMQSACVNLLSVVRPAPQYFSTLSHKWHNFFLGGGVNWTLNVLRFSLQQRFSDVFLILRTIKRELINNVHWSSHKVSVILDRFWWNLNFLNRFFEKYSNDKFYENSSSGSRVVPCGRMDRHDEANSRFSHFANALKNFWHQAQDV